MLPDALRIATPADNDALRELERACPQGTKLRICSERDDYFVRSRLYGNDHTLVAVDRAKDRIFGVIAASTKEVLIGGAPRKIVVFNDLRVHPDYRRTVLARHMLGAWLAMERWAKDVGAHAICGLVKADNEAMLGFQGKKSEYRFVGRMIVLNRAVFRRARIPAAPEPVPAGDPQLSTELWKEYGERDFVPVALRERCPTPEMEATGLFETWRLARRLVGLDRGVPRLDAHAHPRDRHPVVLPARRARVPQRSVQWCPCRTSRNRAGPSATPSCTTTSPRDRKA